jgi:hypothetical protein
LINARRERLKNFFDTNARHEAGLLLDVELPIILTEGQKEPVAYDFRAGTEI